MNDKDLFNFFNNEIFNNPKYQSSGSKRTDAEELDDLWNEYMSYINDLKSDGYKVLRNDAGKHRVIKRGNIDE